MTSSKPQLEKKRFIKWIKRYCANNLDCFMELATSIDSLLSRYGYLWVDMGIDGIRSPVYVIEFNKRDSNNAYFYLCVQFDRYGRNRFSAYFGEKRLNGVEFRPSVMADLVKYQSELWSAKLWGARWYHWNKRRKFLSDWREFEAMIPHIVQFLEHGTPHPKIYVGYQREGLA